MRSAVQEGFNLLLLSHRAWHSVERSLFRESIRGKIKLVPSAPSPLASRHKADDYQLEPAQLQRSTGASQPATKISTVWIWKHLITRRLPVLHRFSTMCLFSVHMIHWHFMQYKTFWNTIYNYILCNPLNAGVCILHWWQKYHGDNGVHCNSVCFEGWYFCRFPALFAAADIHG